MLVDVHSRAQRAMLLCLAGLLVLLSAACGSAEPAPPTPTVVPPTATPTVTPSPSPIPTATALPTDVPPTPTPVPENLLIHRLTSAPDTPEQDLADDLLSDQIGVYGFMAVEADGTVIASRNSELPFITASTYKLVVMADIYRRVELGELSLDQYIVLDGAVFHESIDNYFTQGEIWSSFPLQEYIFAMGAYSSNVGARTLLALTSPEALRETALAIGMEDTYLFTDLADVPTWPPKVGVDGPVEDVVMAQTYLENSFEVTGSINITTPLDMARFMLAILDDSLISPWVSEQVASVLERNVIRDRIPVYFEHIHVLNKPGDLPDATNDVGILFLDDGARAIVTLAQAIPDPDHTMLVEQRLALIGAGVKEIPPLYYGAAPQFMLDVAPATGERHGLRTARRVAAGSR